MRVREGGDEGGDEGGGGEEVGGGEGGEVGVGEGSWVKGENKNLSVSCMCYMCA